MEYKLATGSSWTTCSATETTGLAGGNYLVRYAAYGDCWGPGETTLIVMGVDVEDCVVTMTQGVSDMEVNITNWNGNYKYQIWTWQRITADTILDRSSNVKQTSELCLRIYFGLDMIPAKVDGSINSR